MARCKVSHAALQYEAKNTMKISVVGGGPAGLYFSILMKKTDPSHEITILERNLADVTWGWGVVFSDETLEGFREADEESYKRITNAFARWEAIDIYFKGKVIRSGGHVFYGIRRMKLLQILQDRCRETGVNLKFDCDVFGVEELKEADLIIGADGINSSIRFYHSRKYSRNFSGTRISIR